MDKIQVTYNAGSIPLITTAVDNFCVKETKTPATICMFACLQHKIVKAEMIML